MHELEDDIKAKESLSATWYLRIDGKEVFGPLTLEVLTEWACDGRIGPGNEVSRHKQTWAAIQSLPQVQMVWVAKLSNGKEYGPFNLLATPNLLRWGIMDGRAVMSNIESGSELPLRSLMKSDELPPDVPRKAVADQIREILGDDE